MFISQFCNLIRLPKQINKYMFNHWQTPSFFPLKYVSIRTTILTSSFRKEQLVYPKLCFASTRPHGVKPQNNTSWVINITVYYYMWRSLQKDILFNYYRNSFSTPECYLKWTHFLCTSRRHVGAWAEGRFERVVTASPKSTVRRAFDSHGDSAGLTAITI